MSDDFQLRVFDPNEDISVIERQLPHWGQSGTICFITFRTHDSMPRSVVENWRRDRMLWLRRHNVDPTGSNWQSVFEKLDAISQKEFHEIFSRRWQQELDKCHGPCVLRRRELAEIVAKSLEHFDGERYELTDYVVMPNHVHVMAAFVNEKGMLDQCESWKHYTATRINRRLNCKGRFWQQDGFDHLVRSVEQFEYLRKYIRDNPVKAGLRGEEYVHYSKDI